MKKIFNLSLATAIVFSLSNPALSAKISEEQKKHAQTIIQGYGYPCDKVDTMAGKSNGGWHVSCNSFLHRYEMDKRGKTWVAVKK